MKQLVHYYPTNRVGRTFVSGDWHGCYNQVRMLLDAVNFDFSKDVLYQAGDFVNRGPDSKKCAAMLGEPWFRPVQGNHEQEVVKAATDRCYNWEPLLRHGGGWVNNLSRQTFEELVITIARLPCAIVVGEGKERFNVFHGEFHGNDAELDALNGQRWPPVTLIGGRELFHGIVKPELHAGLSPSFVGHNIVKKPKMIGSHIYIDTGSYHGERQPNNPSGISFIEPSTQEVWQYSRGKVIKTA